MLETAASLEWTAREDVVALLSLDPPMLWAGAPTADFLLRVTELYPELAGRTAPLLADGLRRDGLLDASLVAGILLSPSLARQAVLRPLLQDVVDVLDWEQLLTALHTRRSYRYVDEDTKDVLLQYLAHKFRSRGGPAVPLTRPMAEYMEEVVPHARFYGREPWLAAVLGVGRRVAASSEDASSTESTRPRKKR